ncbi:MAG: sigma-70 family RNA polymerase sigma factor [Pirellulales bacterium]
MGDQDSQLTTHPSLLLRVRNCDDREAWEAFVAIYQPIVYSYCRRKSLQASDAADVAQEVLTRLARAMKSFEYQPELGGFRKWLGTVVLNEIARFVGKQQKDRQSISNEQAEFNSITRGEDWDDHFHSSLLQIALSQIESEFEPETWAAFGRVWLESKSALQAAHELSITVEKIYVAKSRVLKRLRLEVLRLSEDIPFVE